MLLLRKHSPEYYWNVPKNSSEGRQTIRTLYGLEYEIFAEIVKTHRLKSKTSQRKLSVMIGRSDAYIGKLESGKVFPDLMTAIDLVRVLGLEPASVIAQIQIESKKKGR